MDKIYFVILQRWDGDTNIGWFAEEEKAKEFCLKHNLPIGFEDEFYYYKEMPPLG